MKYLLLVVILLITCSGCATSGVHHELGVNASTKDLHRSVVSYESVTTSVSYKITWDH